MNKDHHLNRRAFLKLSLGVGSAAAISPWLSACGQAGGLEPGATDTLESRSGSTSRPSATSPPRLADTPTSQPAPTGTATPAPAPALPGLVVVVRTADRAEGVRRALDALGKRGFNGKDIFLKPNFNSADPPPGSTHATVLSTLVAWLQEAGAQRITVGDRSGMGNTRQVMQHKEVFRMGEELGFEPVVFDELGEHDWERIELEGGHWRGGFALARPVLEADGVVQACCLKTHRYGGHFTLSLKNSVGMVAGRVPGSRHDYMDELHGSPHQRAMIAEINAAYTPDLIVLDGVEAFTQGGPARGTLAHPQVILAGTDRVAIDAAGVAILRSLGTTPAVQQGLIFQQDQLARAVELGLGVGSPHEIELVGPDAESQRFADSLRPILQSG